MKLRKLTLNLDQLMQAGHLIEGSEGNTRSDITMATGESVTILSEHIKNGREEAAQKLWSDYFPQLVRIARQHLRLLPSRVADEEDMALSAMNGFSRAARQDPFPAL